jgi:hypothetical protein
MKTTHDSEEIPFLQAYIRAKGPKRVPLGEPIEQKPRRMKANMHLTGTIILLASLVSVAEAQIPRVVAQPTNEAVLAGSAASFSVAVSGTGPFTYQWQCNGTNIPDGVITTVAGNKYN